MKTFSPKPDSVQSEWLLVDAENQILGRLATQIASRLRGKHRPEYSPHCDVGDFVVVINASKIKVTGDKMKQKTYYRSTGTAGGLKQTPLWDMMAKKPEEVIMHAVKGMLPRGPLGRALLRKLRVFAGQTHEHQAQQPKPVTF